MTKATEAQDLDLSKVMVSLDFNDIPLQKALDEIEDQTALTFAYSYNAIDLGRKVSVRVQQQDVEQVLGHIFKDHRVSWGVSGETVLLKKWQPMGQSSVMEESIQGQVTDAQTGEPIPGVNVILKGTTTGTSTDANGNFELTVESLQDTLVVSFIGYQTKEVPISGQTQLDITLQAQAIQGEEMVVVGYGEQKRENLTTSVDQIDMEEVSTRPSAGISSSLQGLMPGLNIKSNTGDPTKTPEINIRGFNSINGGSPLVLIDGIEGDISRVNPNDIASVTVLKDAASAAIYGARGAFGVILITTKTGKEGDMKVNYTNNFSITTPTTRTDFISDPYVYGRTIDAAIFGYNGSSYTGYNKNDWETIKKVAAGRVEPFHERQADGSHKFFYKTDWYDYLFKKWQPSQYHNISISGGSEKLQGYLSGRIFERETIQNIQDADMKRYNLKANLTFNPVEWLEISSNTKFIQEIDEDFGGYRNGYGGIWSTTTWYNLFPFYPNKIGGVPVDIGRGGNGGQGGAAALEDGHNWRRWNTEELTNTFRAKIDPFDGLVINFDYSNRIDNTSRTYRYNNFDYLTTDRLDLQTVGLNRLGEWRWKDTYNAFNIFGTYSQDLADRHHFKLMLGHNQEQFDRDRILAQSENLLVPDKANLAFGTEMYNMDGSALGWAVRGYFGRFNYDYDAKYLLEINARYDGSSRFPTDSRWGFFPSISAGWQINREEFWSPIENIISSMKLRASYGKLGNQTVDINTFRQLMGLGKSSWLEDGNRINYASAPNPLPREVTWETTTTIDFGVDIGFLENKLTATFDWYQKSIDDMYLPGEPLPAVFGAAEPRENYASLRNRGIEFSLNYNDSFDLWGSELALNVNGSVSNFRGVITKYDNPEGLMSSYWEGQELGQIWGYHVDGQFQSDEEAAAYQESFDNPSNSLGNVYGYILNIVQNSEWNRLRAGDPKYVDIDSDGRIDRGDYTLEDHGDLVPIGNAMPKFPFGFNINARWRDFDVSIAGAGVAKQHWYPTGDIYWGTYQRPYLSFLRKDLVNNAWTSEKPGNTYPQIHRGYAALNGNRSLYELNDYYLENIGYLRIKNLTIGYTLPREFTQGFNIQKFRIYFSGENILTWRFGNLTKYIDPEQAGSAISYSDPGDAAARANIRSYPMGKTFSIGINLSL